MKKCAWLLNDCLYSLSDGGCTSTRDIAGVRSANQSPQSVGSSGMDSGVDSLCDPIADLPHVAISLCGGLTDNKEITRGRRRRKVQEGLDAGETPSSHRGWCIRPHPPSPLCVLVCVQSIFRREQFPTSSSLRTRQSSMTQTWSSR